MSVSSPIALREAAETHAASLPPLLAEAQHLAASVVLGIHGRRQAGTGEEFWQFRPAVPGDPWRSIDWRRSGRSDAHYMRQMEWQAAQSVLLWIDSGQSLAFSGDKSRQTKRDRAVLLGLAAAILLVRGGERVGLIDDAHPAATGTAQIDRIAAQLARHDVGDDHARPSANLFPKGGKALFLSDFLGDFAPIEQAVARAVDRGVTGAIVQILDPVEEAFPFDGRTEFQSMSGALRFETLRARGLKSAYQDKLAARKEALKSVAGRAGWQYLCHHTSVDPLPGLMWIFTALEHRRHR